MTGQRVRQALSLGPLASGFAIPHVLAIIGSQAPLVAACCVGVGVVVLAVWLLRRWRTG
ncbi:MAG TPA: hypothetical protein VF992_08465 [Thermoplasmata archaeon]